MTCWRWLLQLDQVVVLEMASLRWLGYAVAAFGSAHCLLRIEPQAKKVSLRVCS